MKRGSPRQKHPSPERKGEPPREVNLRVETSSNSPAGTPEGSRGTSANTSPELAAQVRSFDAILARQPDELGEFGSEGGTPREEDDDLEWELRDLERSEELLRQELSMFQGHTGRRREAQRPQMAPLELPPPAAIQTQPPFLMSRPPNDEAKEEILPDVEMGQHSTPRSTHDLLQSIASSPEDPFESHTPSPEDEKAPPSSTAESAVVSPTATPASTTWTSPTRQESTPATKASTSAKKGEKDSTPRVTLTPADKQDSRSNLVESGGQALATPLGGGMFQASTPSSSTTPSSSDPSSASSPATDEDASKDDASRPVDAVLRATPVAAGVLLPRRTTGQATPATSSRPPVREVQSAPAASKPPTQSLKSATAASDTVPQSPQPSTRRVEDNIPMSARRLFDDDDVQTEEEMSSISQAETPHTQISSLSDHETPGSVSPHTERDVERRGRVDQPTRVTPPSEPASPDGSPEYQLVWTAAPESESVASSRTDSELTGHTPPAQNRRTQEAQEFLLAETLGPPKPTSDRSDSKSKLQTLTSEKPSSSEEQTKATSSIRADALGFGAAAGALGVASMIPRDDTVSQSKLVVDSSPRVSSRSDAVTPVQQGRNIPGSTDSTPEATGLDSTQNISMIAALSSRSLGVGEAESLSGPTASNPPVVAAAASTTAMLGSGGTPSVQRNEATESTERLSSAAAAPTSEGVVPASMTAPSAVTFLLLSRNIDRRCLAPWLLLLACLLISAAVIIPTSIVFSQNEEANPMPLPTEQPSNDPSPGLRPTVSRYPSTPLSPAPTNLPNVVPTETPISRIPTDQNPTRAPFDRSTLTPSVIPTFRPSTIELPTLGPSLPSEPPISSFMPTQQKTSAPSFSEQALFDYLVSISPDGGAALQNTSSPQFMAFEWLSGNSLLGTYSDQRIQQRYSLASLYYSTNGDEWTFNRLWLSNDNECLWYSRASFRLTACSTGSEFRRLDLSYNNLHGTLPNEISLLSGLQSISITGGPNRVLVGSIPSYFGALTQLQEFRAPDNALSGSLATDLFQLTMLRVLDLGRNQLIGTLNADIDRWRMLQWLDLADNMIAGRMPLEIGNLTNLVYLRLNSNRMTGPVATTISNLQRLGTFTADNNQFNHLPSELGQLRSVQILSLANNALQGRIPPELGNLRSIIVLSLRGNMLSGQIPSSLGRLTTLADGLDLSQNQLSSTIPEELGLINGPLRTLLLNANPLVGTVPDSFANFTGTTLIRLDATQLIGSIPDSVCQVWNRTMPIVFVECSLACGCCSYCCVNNVCKCEYSGTPEEWKCIY